MNPLPRSFALALRSLAAVWLLLTATPLPAATTTLHYQRPAGDYAGWGLHLWGDGLADAERVGWASPKRFDGTDDFGRVAVVELKDAGKSLGFIIHSGDNKDVAQDRFYVPRSSPEIWLRQGDARIYTHKPDGTIGKAIIHYSRPAGDYQGWGLHLWGNGIAADQSTTWQNPRPFEGQDAFGRFAGIALGDPQKPVNFLIHRSSEKDTPNDRAFLPKTQPEIWIVQGDPAVYDSDPTQGVKATRPGVSYGPQESTFALWSPDTADLQLWLDGKTFPLKRVPDRDGYTDVYAVTVPGDHHFKPYYFVVAGKVARDPYAVMADAGSDRSIVMDVASVEPQGGWATHPPLPEREDAVIYEASVRDFTIDPDSGVDADKRGKFLGMIQPGTRHQGQTTGLDHLKELGITHIQLLPFYDYVSCSPPALASNPGCYSWGYDPANYNVPEERYASSAGDYEARVRELKTMINEFHKAGIRVVMDVVYNHTGDRSLANITPRYYSAIDLSGVGNGIAGSVPMVSRMIRDSLEFWVREYHLDGFRFDLIGTFDYRTVGEWGRYLNGKFPDRQLLLYGEPWNGFVADPAEPQRVRLGTVARIGDAHVGVFNPKFREAIKGNNDDGGGGGFAFNRGDRWQIQVGSRGGIRFANNPGQTIDTWDPMFVIDPEQCINYVSAHDNLTLWDKIQAWAKLNGRTKPEDQGYLKRVQEFANGIVLTSQGIPFIHSGAEMLRTKNGVHNSYNAGDEVNQIRWQWKAANEDMFRYYRQAIALRRAHPGLRMNTWDEINRNVVSSQPRDGVVVNRIDSAANGDNWREMIVIYNSGSDFSYSLPDGTWKVAMERSDPAAGNDREVSGQITAEGTAVTVVHR